MNPRAFDFFVNTTLKQALPEVQEFFKNWPSPEDDPSYPFCSLMLVSSRPEDTIAQPMYLGREGDKSVYQTRSWVSQLALHYFCQRPEELVTAQNNILDLFVTDLKTGTSGSITVNFGEKAWEYAVFRLLSSEIGSSDESLRRGERRSITSIQCESSHIKAIKEPVWTGYEIDPHISERPR